ncbi:hypothetical protein [Candidatus Laterigemmans baculatus]|nr:hypothetical protein [Candidatus Laterigemmans baculatus]
MNRLWQDCLQNRMQNTMDVCEAIYSRRGRDRSVSASDEEGQCRRKR